MKPTIIHIHRGRIDGNRKHGRREPPIIVRRGRTRNYGTVVQVGDNTFIRYSPDQPLDCGARVWIETTEPVRVIEPSVSENADVPDALGKGGVCELAR